MNSSEIRDDSVKPQKQPITLNFVPSRGVHLKTNTGWPLYTWSEGILDKNDKDACIRAAWDWINENNPDNSEVKLTVKGA